MIIDPKILSLIAGILAGVIRSVVGWFDSGEAFDPKLFINTLIRTAIAGAAFGFALNQTPMVTFFETYFTDSLLNKSWKIVKKEV